MAALHPSEHAEVVRNGFVNDIRALEQRIGKLRKGLVRFVDIDSKAASEAATKLDEIRAIISTSIITSED